MIGKLGAALLNGSRTLTLESSGLLESSVRSACCSSEHRRNFRLSSFQCRTVEDRTQVLRSAVKREEGTEGERGTLNVDLLFRGNDDMFPDEDTPDRVFSGVKFAELPIVHIKATRNNTIFQCTNFRGDHVWIRSCGMEGFKGCRRGTNVAAQATAISLAAKVQGLGIRTVRVKIQGLGPGRMASIKGLQMGGMNIVSLTDDTPISFNPPRPRKARRL